jgi:hypothetical protein
MPGARTIASASDSSSPPPPPANRFVILSAAMPAIAPISDVSVPAATLPRVPPPKR